MPDDHIFEIVDYTGKAVVFSKAKWEEKRSRHPELNNAAFLKRLRRAIIDPDEVWEDYEDRENRACYYKKYSDASYAKIVVWTGARGSRVVTAYETSHIKEAEYPELRRIK
jgi:hypothetical protein